MLAADEILPGKGVGRVIKLALSSAYGKFDEPKPRPKPKARYVPSFARTAATAGQMGVDFGNGVTYFPPTQSVKKGSK